MDLTLPDAATALGKSERQVRYLIKTGRLAAKKKAGRWFISSADLPLDERRRSELAARLGTAREILESSLAPLEKAVDGEEKKRYSVKNLEAFTAGREIFQEAQGLEVSAAVPILLDAMIQVTIGCHASHPQEKASAFVQARRLAATAVTHFLLSGEERQEAHADRIERELIPRIGGLIAAHEKKKRRDRFERYGGGSSR